MKFKNKSTSFKVDSRQVGKLDRYEAALREDDGTFIVGGQAGETRLEAVNNLTARLKSIVETFQKREQEREERAKASA
jgi:hypothetical protein